MLEDDGDIVRGLGFVALYSAYLEEQIDNLLLLLSPIEEFSEDKQRWQTSRKIKQVKYVIDAIEFDGKDELIADLDTCKNLFEDRNKFVHGRIYGNYDRSDTLKSGRPNTPDQEIQSAELYKLANECDDFIAAIYRPMIIKIPRAIEQYLNEKA